MNANEKRFGKTTGIMQKIETISITLESSNLSAESIDKAMKPAAELAEVLGCTANQAILFSLIFTLNMKSGAVQINELAEYIGCNPISVVNMLDDFDELAQKRFIKSEFRRRSRGTNLNDVMWNVPLNVLNNIQTGQKPGVKKAETLTFTAFVEATWELYCLVKDSQMEPNQLDEEIWNLISANMQLPLCRQIHKYRLEPESAHCILILVHEILDGDLSTSIDYIASLVYGRHLQKKLDMKLALVKRRPTAFLHKLIDLAGDEFRNEQNVQLTDFGQKTMLGEFRVLISPGEMKTRGNIITHTSVQKKDLFFSPKERELVNKIQDIMQEKSLNELNSRLSKAGLPAGLTILFHGEPGTGKTESVMQLARITKRDLMMVDISQTKTKWFGESEKLIKKVFDDYNIMCGQMKKKPILFFNEADAIFSKRKDALSSNVAQTENAIQNIILQEMERFQGILVATTNLTSNFDRAFDRRFLFKVQFSKPSVEARATIWKSRMRWLKQAEALRLATAWNFSGGQIENIARKCIIDQLITGRNPSIEEIMHICSTEECNTGSRKSIGFSNGS